MLYEVITGIISDKIHSDNGVWNYYQPVIPGKDAGWPPSDFYNISPGIEFFYPNPVSYPEGAVDEQHDPCDYIRKCRLGCQANYDSSDTKGSNGCGKCGSCDPEMF